MTLSSIYNRVHFYAGNVYRLLTSFIYQRNIDVDKAVSIFTVSFEKGGCHHIVKTLEEFDEYPDIDYRDTAMYDFLKNFSPTSICDLCDNGGRVNSNFPLFMYPWGTFRIGEISSCKDPSTSRFCGPSSDEFIKEEFDRTIALYKRIKKNGYRPWLFGNTFIGGAFLIRNNGDRRFVVLQGNHRIAILSHLGYERITVRNVKGYMGVIKESCIDNWLLVKLGKCSESAARAVFDLYFKDNTKVIGEMTSNK